MGTFKANDVLPLGKIQYIPARFEELHAVKIFIDIA